MRRELSADSAKDTLSTLKEKIKAAMPRCYPRLIQHISPVCAPNLSRLVLEGAALDVDVIVDLGSGCNRFHENIINVDLNAYPNVDLVCSVERLPFSEASVDRVISVAVLEHVEDPELVVKEIYRVLKPGGQVCCYVPFMQGIHASPCDFQRYTPKGLDRLFRSFTERNVVVASGPSSGFAWLLQEWLAMLFSLGSTRLYWFFYFLFFVVTPIKYLDYLMIRHSKAEKIASGFVIRARKPSGGERGLVEEFPRLPGSSRA